MPHPSPAAASLFLQRATVRRPADISGTGLFTARPSTLTIRPRDTALPAGLHFRRVDLPGKPVIPALVSHVAPDSRHTLLRQDPGDPTSPEVHTTEHILSALTGAGVTDALLDLHGPEVPIADGSALPFVSAVQQAGLTRIHGPVHATDAGGQGVEGEGGVLPLLPFEEVRSQDGPASVRWLPPASAEDSATLALEYHLDYGPGSSLPAQISRLHIEWTSDGPRSAYDHDIAPARTFCLLAEARALQAAGLFLHVGPSQMLVIGDDGRPVENSLRFPDEPARHKLLDLLGDLALVGRPLAGRIIAKRSGHALNHALARTIWRMCSSRSS